MKTIHAFALGFGLVVVGCAAPTSSEDDVATTSEAATLRSNPLNTVNVPSGLGLAATAPVVRQIIRTKNHNCNSIVGTGGEWNGEALTTAIGPSTAFCTFAWAPAGKNRPADWSVLNAAAETDEIRSSPYIVQDSRASNDPAGPVSLGGPDTFTAVALGGPDTFPAFGGIFTVGGGAPSAGSQGLGLTAQRRSFPQGVHGCEVCQELIGDYIFAVLPPEAFAGGPLVLQTETAAYPIGSVSSSLFYFPTPATYEGWSYISWE